MKSLNIMILALFFSTIGCASKATLVFEPKGDKQCSPGGLTLDQSKQKLLSAKIQTKRSFCGRKTGVSVMTMCGAPTTNILIHEIESTDLNKAQTKGFKDAALLVNEAQGTGYAIEKCD